MTTPHPLAKRYLHNRNQRKGIRAIDPASLPQEYVVRQYQPNKKGEFAGQKVHWRNGAPHVRLTLRQARFHLDHGVIELYVSKPADPDDKATLSKSETAPAREN